MSAASEIRTVWTVWPLMSIPRMLRACVSASSGVAANLTPPALPRPPAFTWALTITGPPSCSAAARACSGVDTTTWAVTGTPYFPNSSFACHSNRSTAGQVTDRRSGGVRRGHVRGHPVDDLSSGGAGREDLGHPEILQRGDVGVRDDAAAEDDDVGGGPLAEQLEDATEQRHVRAGQDRQPDRLRVLLERGLDHLLRGLVEPGVDDLHAGVAKRPGDDLGTAVVTIETGLGDHHPDG